MIGPFSWLGRRWLTRNLTCDHAISRSRRLGRGMVETPSANIGRTIFAGVLTAVLASGTVSTVLADGGTGGTSNDLSTGGAGGAGATGTAGSPGNTSGAQGGGGGGGGAGGGTGGVGGAGAGSGGAAGTGGTSGVPNGGNGGNGSVGGGGGGGGGGYNGNGSGSATITNGSPLTGGTGGTGGKGANGGGGGGGGAGGYGAIVTGGGASSNTSTITGGNGGTGGGILSGTGSGGNGGDGGVGVQFTGLNAIFTNSGTVTGGDGGTGGIGGSNGSPGIGGVGIVGSSLNVINSGTIGGGQSGDGLTQANAITFSGGNNSLELQSGYGFVGNVVGSSGDTLKLGGTTNAIFDVSQIGPAAVFQGFSLFEKTGSSTWTLTGTTAAATPWAINQGTLSISSDSNLGASGPISFDGGTLQFGANGITSSRTITLNAGGGTFDTQSFTATLSGQLTGLGGVRVTGNGGTLILTNSSNNYTGTTTVDATNTLIATDNSLAGVTGALTNNGTTIFKQTADSSGVFGGNISNAGSLIFTQAAGTTGTYGGVISDGTSAGTVEIGGVGGGGTFNFTGLNTYTGTTTVDATNTLIATDNSLSGVTGTLTNNGTTIFKQTADSSGVFGGDISNAGSLIFTQAAGTTGTYAGVISDGISAGTVEIGGTGGGGTFNLTGLNTYTGTTTVDATNTLIATDNSLAGVTGALTNNGTTIFKQTADSSGVFGGNISNAGSLIFTQAAGTTGTYGGVISDGTSAGTVEIGGTGGGGTFNVTGLNTYTGTTTVDATNTLIATDNSLAGVTGALTNNGTTIFKQTVDSSGVFGGDISNAGSLIFTQAAGTTGTYGGAISDGTSVGTVEIGGVGGGGTFNLTGLNTYTGTTTVDANNTLIATDNSLAGVTGALTNNATTIFKQTVDSSGVFGGDISNAGSLIFTQAAGTTGTYGGAISDGTSAGTVEIGGVGGGGTIVFTGTSTNTGLTTVDSGNTLMVNGSMTGAVSVDGTLMGQGSVGTTTIQSGGTLQPGTVGAPLTINGNLTQAAGSTFAVQVNPMASEQVIVNGTADISSSGTTMNLTIAPGSYTPGQSYTLLTTSGGLTGTFGTTVQTGGSSNLIFVEKYLSNELDLVVLPTAVGSGDIYANMATIGVQTSTAELQLISNRLAGLAGPFSSNSGVASTTPSVSTVRLASSSANGSVRVLPCQLWPQNESTWTTWAQGYGLAGNLSGGFNYGLGGTVFGADRWLDESNMVGVLGGYAGTSLGQSATNAHSQINGYQVGLYELHRQELFYLSNIDAFSNSTYNVSREAIPGLTATGNSHGNQWSHYTEAGLTLGDGSIRMQPFAGLQYIYLDQGGFTESGAGNLNMTTNSQIVNSTRGNLGLRLSHDLYLGGIRVVPMVAARYQREWGNGTQLLSSSFQGAPTLIYSTTGGKTGRDFGLFTIGGTAFLTNHCSLYGSVDTQVASYYTAVMGSGGFQLAW